MRRRPELLRQPATGTLRKSRTRQANVNHYTATATVRQNDRSGRARPSRLGGSRHVEHETGGEFGERRGRRAQTDNVSIHMKVRGAPTVTWRSGTSDAAPPNEEA